MSQELRATYSVKDHLWPRALAADIMLFDRLVFPVPDEARFSENSGRPDEGRPVEWARNPVEWAWGQKEDWYPERQERLLKLWEPVSRKLTWNKARHDTWRVQVAKRAVENVPDWLFVVTRMALTRDLSA